MTVPFLDVVHVQATERFPSNASSASETVGKQIMTSINAKATTAHQADLRRVSERRRPTVRGLPPSRATDPLQATVTVRLAHSDEAQLVTSCGLERFRAGGASRWKATLYVCSAPVQCVHRPSAQVDAQRE